jgi:tRNA threonylcarbamoyladenosine modification (KEOPS) complex  Pcc1 subunit
MKAEINFNCNSKDIIKLFTPEEKKFPNNRVSYSIEEIKGGVKFKIEYADVPALKAVINSITNLLTVYSKTMEIIKNE